MSKVYDKQIDKIVYSSRDLITNYFYPMSGRLLTANGCRLEVVAPARSVRYRSQRIELEAQCKKRLSINGMPFLRLTKQPNKIVAYMNIIGLNEDNRTIGTRILRDIDKYLGDIKVVRDVSNYVNYQAPTSTPDPRIAMTVDNYPDITIPVTRFSRLYAQEYPTTEVSSSYGLMPDIFSEIVDQPDPAEPDCTGPCCRDEVSGDC